MPTRAGPVEPTARTDRPDARHGDRRSTVRSTEGEPAFTGREAELGAIEDALRARPAVVIHGAPGLGKTRLAREYAHRHAATYPGGMFFVPFDRPPPIELAKLGRDADPPRHSDDSLDDRCRRALRELGAAGRVLLIYDALIDERTLRDWLPYEGLDWHLIATSTSASWARSWQAVELGPLSDRAARELAATILGRDAAAARLVEPIVGRAAGLTIELCASAAAVHEQLRRGGTVEQVTAEIATETASSFESAWALLSDDARLVLQVASTFATPRIPIALVDSLLQHHQWSPRRIATAIDRLRDRKLVGAQHDALEVHRLVARFVRNRGSLDRAARQWLFHDLLAAARALSQQPGDLDRCDRMLAYSPALADWAPVIGDGHEAHTIGKALGKLGRFADALPWFERAVADKERARAEGRTEGRTKGRVDPESIGASLHQVGYCYSHLGRFADALPWFERAVASKQRGDARGRVHAASLGTSLHQVGHCHAQLGRLEDALPWFERAIAMAQVSDGPDRVDSIVLGASLHSVGVHYQNLGKYSEALSWFERAVAAKQRGDRRGRVDPARLGASLLCVGQCHIHLGRHAEALPWLERAVAASQQGDVHGRLNHESLGDSQLWLGICYWGLGKHVEATTWCEQSIASKQKGDEHGRVDHASVGKSLGQVGACYLEAGRFAEALPWLERAVTAKQQGDIHGRVDPASVGRSLHHVGSCLVGLRSFAEALPWFERAAVALEQGDAHGRVDTRSLGLSLQAIADCCENLGNLEDARLWRERASRILQNEDTRRDR